MDYLCKALPSHKPHKCSFSAALLQHRNGFSMSYTMSVLTNPYCECLRFSYHGAKEVCTCSAVVRAKIQLFSVPLLACWSLLFPQCAGVPLSSHYKEVVRFACHSLLNPDRGVTGDLQVEKPVKVHISQCKSACSSILSLVGWFGGGRGGGLVCVCVCVLSFWYRLTWMSHPF